jgi:L-prolyl-PCP dehydrogenase
LDFAITDSQHALQVSMRKLGRSSLGATPPSAFRARWALAGELGLLGMLIPESLGGRGLDALSTAIALEALGETCTDQGFLHAICTQIICSLHILRFGSAEQHAFFLPPMCRGELIFAQAMTEPNAGSDTSAIETAARVDGEGYRVNGRKCFISNAPVCDFAIVFAVTDEAVSPIERISCLLLDVRLDGVVVGPALPKMGLESLNSGDLTFHDVHLTADRLLGRRGSGNAMFREMIEWERILLFAVHNGKLAQVVKDTAKHARSRRQFGQAIASFQAVAHRIADMRIQMELGRLMIHKAAWLKANGRSAAVEAAICKLFVSESLKSACLDALQIRAAAAYMTNGGAEQDVRDAVAATLYSGTSEIQRNLIAALTY